jgi:hypothetical protein
VTAQTVGLELFLSGAYTAVPLYSAAGVTITRGHEPDGSWPRPSRIEVELNNDSLAYDPARPESALYGVAGRNTKGRVIVNGTTRLYGEASAWRAERTPEHSPGVRGRSWTSLTAEGVLRRLGQWTDPLRSPMYRTISGRSTSIGHWPLEEDSGALALANSVAGGAAGTFKGGVTLAETDAPLGAEQTIAVGANTQLAGRFSNASTSAGWQVGFSFHLAALPPSATYGELLRWTVSNGNTWIVEVNNTTYQFRVVDADGVAVWSSGAITFGTGAEPSNWVTMRIKAFQSGGNIQVEPAWYVQGQTSAWGITATFAGTIAGLRQWWQNGNSVVSGGHFSHVYAVTGVTDDLVSGVSAAVFNGYSGEAALTRFSRLCTELGIVKYAIGTAAESTLMGPQRADTFLNLLKEIRDTEGGRIDDERSDIALTMRTRRNTFNLTAALTLVYPSQVALPFNRILDDANTHNRVTVKNESGGEVTSSLLTGSMSVLAPPNGVGEYKQTIDVNVSNPATQLPDIADWWRARGTIERPRYDEVTVDLLANPSLAATAVAVREGDRIDITGAEPGTVSLYVTGMVEKIGAATWTLTYLTDLYDVWIIGVYDDGTWRWDTQTTTLAAGATSTATSLSLTTTDLNDVLTTAAGSLPYDLIIGGEQVRVTAMTAAAGTGPYTQTATVTRSINSVVKAQTSATSVNVYDSRRWGL